MSSPLQQALRRALINAAESEENTKLDALMEAFSNASGINQVVVMSALDGLIKQSSTTTASISEDTIALA